MFERIHDYISRYANTPPSNDEFEQIKAALHPKFFRKRQYFLQKGEVCNYFGFINKGAMRQYSIDDKGVEYIVNLSLENWWVGDRESWATSKPSIYNIEAWEDTEMLLITRADTLRLAQSIPAFDEAVRMMDERHSIANQKRINAAISLSAEERYHAFVSNYPDFLQRFPLHMIASYLGVTKETLSRVRRQTNL